MIAMPIVITGITVDSIPTARPAMMFVAGPVWLASAMLSTGRERDLGEEWVMNTNAIDVRMPIRPQRKKCHHAPGVSAGLSSVRVAKKKATVTSAEVT